MNRYVLIRLRNRIVIEDVIDKDNPAKSVIEPEKFQEKMRFEKE